MLFACQGKVDHDHARLGGQQLHATTRIPENRSGQAAKLFVRKLVSYANGRLEARTRERSSVNSCKRTDQNVKQRVAREMPHEPLQADRASRGLCAEEQMHMVRELDELRTQTRELHAKYRLNR